MVKGKEEISLKNTKAEILEALNEALKREKDMSKIKSEPEKDEKKKKEEMDLKESKANVEANIFSMELNEKYKKLESSILVLENRLKELYSIEKELNNLTLIINAHKDLVLSLEEKERVKREEISNNLNKLEIEYKEKEEDIKKNYDKLSRNLKIERDREIEEYNYKLKRDREIENNKWEDDKKRRLADITLKEEETNKLLSQAQENEKRYKELEEKVSKIPELLNSEYKRAQQETTTELQRDFKYEKELLVAEYKNTIDRQNDKLESLNLEIEKLNNMNINLQEKMDKAYAELKDIATRTVEANGGVKIIGNNTQDNK